MIRNLFLMSTFVYPFFLLSGDLTLTTNRALKTVNRISTKESHPLFSNQSEKAYISYQNQTELAQTFRGYLNQTITSQVIRKSFRAVAIGSLVELAIQHAFPHDQFYSFFPYALALPSALFLIRFALYLDPGYPRP